MKVIQCEHVHLKQTMNGYALLIQKLHVVKALPRIVQNTLEQGDFSQV